jgi:hypothetical protein
VFQWQALMRGACPAVVQFKGNWIERGPMRRSFTEEAQTAFKPCDAHEYFDLQGPWFFLSMHGACITTETVYTCRADCKNPLYPMDELPCQPLDTPGIDGFERTRLASGAFCPGNNYWNLAPAARQNSRNRDV